VVVPIEGAMKKEPFHGINIENIAFKSIDDIKQFLDSGVREGTLLEFKEQFPKRLDKAISSMANTYGGLILIGVEETTTGGGVVPIKGVILEPGLRERVIGIGLNAIYPPIIPDVRIVEFKSSDALEHPDRAVVSIRVDESEAGGHAVDGRTAVYIRADNVSDPIKKATVDEQEWFRNKREKSHREKSRILENAQRHAQHFLQRLRERHSLSTSQPKGRFAFWTVPTFPRAPIAPPKELYTATQRLMIPMRSL
jgi:predicted HTH transcriptional regulator